MAGASLLWQVSRSRKYESYSSPSLTGLQRALPVAGLTAGLALYPKGSVRAEEPIADSTTQIVSTLTH